MEPFTVLLVSGAEWLLWGCLAWTTVLLGAAFVEALSGGRLRCTRWVPCPTLWRRALVAGLGVALATGAGMTGVAASNRDPSADRLPVPARPLDADGHPAENTTTRPGEDATRGPGEAPSGAGAGSRNRILEVAPGDCLWTLAEARLGVPAPASEVAAYVHRLHRANRAVIGPDPDLIKPGQRLVQPVPGESR